MKKFNLLIAISLLAILLISCNKDEEEKDTPEVEIVGCDQVNYQDYTYDINISPGVASFNVEIIEDGHHGCFYITVQGGCISTAEVIDCDF